MKGVEFKVSRERPYHLSVGAVLVNQVGEVACHHFTNVSGISEFYILMRETLKTGESLGSALARGLKEEFGATAETLAYIGSLTHTISGEEYKWEKTVLYFLCQLRELGERNPDDEEAQSSIEWYNPEYLQQLMSNPQVVHAGEVLDESTIIQNAIAYLSKQKKSN